MQRSTNNLKFKLQILKLLIRNVWEVFILKLIFDTMKTDILAFGTPRRCRAGMWRNDCQIGF